MAFDTTMKPVYVPAVVRRLKAETTPRLPAAMARTPVGRVVRGIPWSGAPVEAPPPPPAAAMDVRMSARAAFAGIPWNGAAPLPPTQAQVASSVRAVLDKFRWE